MVTTPDNQQDMLSGVQKHADVITFDKYLPIFQPHMSNCDCEIIDLKDGRLERSVCDGESMAAVEGVDCVPVMGGNDDMDAGEIDHGTFEPVIVTGDAAISLTQKLNVSDEDEDTKSANFNDSAKSIEFSRLSLAETCAENKSASLTSNEWIYDGNLDSSGDDDDYVSTTAIINDNHNSMDKEGSEANGAKICSIFTQYLISLSGDLETLHESLNNKNIRVDDASHENSVSKKCEVSFNSDNSGDNDPNENCNLCAPTVHESSYKKCQGSDAAILDITNTSQSPFQSSNIHPIHCSSCCQTQQDLLNSSNPYDLKIQVQHSKCSSPTNSSTLLNEDSTTKWLTGPNQSTEMAITETSVAESQTCSNWQVTGDKCAIYVEGVGVKSQLNGLSQDLSKRATGVVQNKDSVSIKSVKDCCVVYHKQGGRLDNGGKNGCAMVSESASGSCRKDCSKSDSSSDSSDGSKGVDIYFNELPSESDLDSSDDQKSTGNVTGSDNRYGCAIEDAFAKDEKDNCSVTREQKNATFPRTNCCIVRNSTKYRSSQMLNELFNETPTKTITCPCISMLQKDSSHQVVLRRRVDVNKKRKPRPSSCSFLTSGSTEKEISVGLKRFSLYNFGEFLRDDCKSKNAEKDVCVKRASSVAVLDWEKEEAQKFTREKLKHRSGSDLAVLYEQIKRQSQAVSEELVVLLQERHELQEQVEMRRIAIEQLGRLQPDLERQIQEDIKVEIENRRQRNSVGR